MFPVTAWQHGQVPGSSPFEQTQPSSKQVIDLSDAEQLVVDYGHLEEDIKSKRRK